MADEKKPAKEPVTLEEMFAWAEVAGLDVMLHLEHRAVGTDADGEVVWPKYTASVDKYPPTANMAIGGKTAATALAQAILRWEQFTARQQGNGAASPGALAPDDDKDEE